jgi:predicted nucleic acid-binding protein
MSLMLDTNVLSKLCHPRKFADVSRWLESLLKKSPPERVIVPELADYELRRELIRMIGKGQGGDKALQRLNDLSTTLEYLPIITAQIHSAAQLWAQARNSGMPSASKDALDGDVILAAQALSVQATVVTSNRKHLAAYGLDAKDWHEL